MKQRILALALTIGLLFSIAPASRAAEYSDVPADHWAAADIQAAAEAGLFRGVGGGKFGLGSSMTRAAFATALMRLFGWETVAPTGRVFSDVPKGSWYAAAVETAVAAGAVPTYSAAFRPLDAITREEMVTMLVRGLGYNALAAGQAERQPFSDVTTNRGYIALAADLGLVKGFRGGLFKPQQTATREQAAALLVRLHTRLEADSRQVNSTAGYTVLTIPTPTASAATAVPSTPLEPIASLYTALRERKEAGADLSRVVLALTPGGWMTSVQGDTILSSRSVSAEEVERLLERDGVSLHYAAQYESGYLTYEEHGRTVTVWYQSEDSMAAKLQLARLFGVTLYRC